MLGHRNVSLLILLLAVGPLAHAQQDLEDIRPKISDESEALAEVDESITIMARVLKKSIERRFARADEDQPSETALREALVDSRQVQQEATEAFMAHMRGSMRTSSRDVTSARGFLLPEIGVVFVLNVELPIEKLELKRGKDSLWEEAKDEIERGTDTTAGKAVTLYQSQQAEKYRFVPDGIDHTINGVLDALARHGRRLEGIRSDQKIFVTIRLNNRSPFAWISEGRNIVISIEKGNVESLSPDAKAEDIASAAVIQRY